MTRDWKCPDCKEPLSVSEACTAEDEWLFVCPHCKVTFTLSELIEDELDRQDEAKQK